MRSGMEDWGIELTGRKMWYEGWPTDQAGNYRRPVEEEIHTTYGISGEAVAETLSYFENCGGDTKRLVILLNDHALDDRYQVNREILADPSRWYNHEYYFYFIMFAKKVIGRYDFSLEECQVSPLGQYHCPYESPSLSYPPWGYQTNGKKIKEESGIFLIGLFNYTRDLLATDQTKMQFEDEIVRFVQDILDQEYGKQFSLDFLLNEFNWYTTEFLTYFIAFCCIFSNKNNIDEEFSYYYLTHSSPFILFFLKRLAVFGVRFMFEKITNLTADYDIIKMGQIFPNSFSFKVAFKTHHILKYGKYPYMKFYLKHMELAYKGNITALLKIIYRLKKVPEFITIKKCDNLSDYFEFYVQFNRLRPPKFYYFVPAILTAALGLIIPHHFFLIFISVMSVLLSFFLLRERQNLLDIERVVRESLIDYEKSVERMEIMTNSLWDERNMLEETVQVRTSELAEANLKLQELDRVKTDFFSNISHELRTPLTLMMGMLEYVMNKTEGNSLNKYDGKFQLILHYSQQLLRLINMLLDMSKIEAGKMVLHKKRINIYDYINSLVMILQSAVEARGLSVRFHSDYNNIGLSIDPDLFEKALANLLSNAVKFTPDGGKIDVFLEKKNNHILISVEDSGIGIPQDKFSKIFERFGQLDSSATRKYAGSGIGLAFTREIIELHGGTISVKSELDHGSVFTITMNSDAREVSNREVELYDLQVKAPYLLSNISVVQTKTRKHEKQNPFDPKRKTIMIVDDNPDMQNYLETLLENEFNTVKLGGGRECLEHLKCQLPDIIISDVMMPEMSGFDLVNKLKSDPQYSSLPVILVTAKADEGAKIESLEYGADDYLTKPFDKKELYARIKNLLKNRELQTELSRQKMDIDTDLLQASLVQRTILTPKGNHAEIGDLEIYISYHPMNGLISGDYYNIDKHDNGDISVLIADASGHGIQAALSTMQIDILNKESLEIINPRNKMLFLNHGLTERLNSKNFFTAFLATIHPDSIEFSSAAHPGQYLARASDHSIIALKPHGKILGMLPDCDFSVGKESFASGDVLFLFTDGVFEELNPDSLENSEKRLLAFLEKNAFQGNPEGIVKNLLDELYRYSVEDTFYDDLTIICIKKKKC